MPIRLLALLAVILALLWAFLIWAFGKRPALSLFGLVLVFAAVQVLGSRWRLSPVWIFLVDFALITVTVGYWFQASSAMPSWNVVFSVTIMVGVVAIAAVAHELNYPDVWVARMDGLLVLVLSLISFIRAVWRGET